MAVDMSIPHKTRSRNVTQKYHDFIQTFYDDNPIKTDIVTSNRELAERYALSIIAVTKMLDKLEAKGVIKRSYEQRGRNGGRKTHITLTKGVVAAKRAVVVSYNDNPRATPIFSIVPNVYREEETPMTAPEPIQSAREWADKARAYQAKKNAILNGYAALKMAGIEVNHDTYMSSIDMFEDPTLEAICLVLPCIDYGNDAPTIG